MNKYINVCLIISLFANPVATLAQDDNPAMACREAANLFEDGALAEAIEEAKWCVESMQQLKQQATASFFPDEIIGYTGDKMQSQSNFGIRTMERTYSKDSERIKVNFTAGGAGGGLAALAKMGLAMGGTGKKLRINRYKVLDTSEGQNVNFMITMKEGGGMLTISSNSASYENTIEFIKAMPLKKIDKATAQ